MSRYDDSTKGNVLDYLYHPNYFKLIGIDSLRQTLFLNKLILQGTMMVREFAKSRAKRAYVPTCLRASVVYVPMCQSANVPKTCQLLIFTCQRASKHTNVPINVPTSQ